MYATWNNFLMIKKFKIHILVGIFNKINPPTYKLINVKKKR